jgi:hypothetical protein
MSWQEISPTNRELASEDVTKIACELLTQEELEVWLTKHIAGKGRRSGSLALGITEDAWRYRIQKADLKILNHIRQEPA